MLTRKRKLNTKKNFIFCRANKSFSINKKIDSSGRTINPLFYLPWTPFFQFSVNDSFSMKKMVKSTRKFPSYFRFYMCRNFFITIGRIIKKWEYGPLKVMCSFSFNLTCHNSILLVPLFVTFACVSLLNKFKFSNNLNFTVFLATMFRGM